MHKTKLGQELIFGLKEAVAHAHGAKKLRKTTLEIPAPARLWRKEQIASLRRGFGVSQPVFASLLNVTASTVRAWEQGWNSPSGPARRLLEVAYIEPEIFQRLAHKHPGTAYNH
ncbi:MAG: transcriptional regulator [Elusimicrobiota bacterium]|nr:transcriptional regulator [Elusimicrobiota bacterium]